MEKKFICLVGEIMAIVFAAFFFVGCDKSGLRGDAGEGGEDNKGVEVIEQKPIVLTAGERAISEKVNDFGLASFASLVGQTELSSRSFVYSPFSLAMALSLCQSGAHGETFDQLAEVLGFQALSNSELMAYCEKLTGGLSAVDTSTVFRSSNAIFGDEPVVFSNEFSENAKSYFGADVRTLDMKTEEAVDAINSWCKEKTDGMIESIVQYPWNPPFVMLANALLFKAKWPVNSMPEVGEDVFQSSAGPETCPFLNFTGYYSYFSREAFRAISLPYGNGSYNLLLALPEEGKTVGDIVGGLGEVVDVLTSSEDQYPRYVQCSFPEFRIDGSELALREMLVGLGAVDMFDRTKADFSVMSESTPIYFTDAFQKAVIEVNEKGTEASAVTAVAGSSDGSGPLPFKIDRAFFFMVYEKGSGAILFAGQKM